MRYDWGPWIEHDGRGCPVEVVGKLVHVRWARAIQSNDRPPSDALEIDPDLQGAVIVSSGNPKMWTWGRADDPMTWSRRGRVISVPIIRYRVRRPLVAEFLADVTADLDAPRDAPKLVPAA